jgi:hypothetical protein
MTEEHIFSTLTLTKITELDNSFGVDQDIAGLDVAMNDLSTM